MPVRRRPSARRHMHINQTKAAIGVIAGEQNGVRISHDTDMRNLLVVSLRQCKSPPEIISRNLRTRSRASTAIVAHFYPLVLTGQPMTTDLTSDLSVRKDLTNNYLNRQLPWSSVYRPEPPGRAHFRLFSRFERRASFEGLATSNLKPRNGQSTNASNPCLSSRSCLPAPVRFSNFLRCHWRVRATIWRTAEAHSKLSPMHQCQRLR